MNRKAKSVISSLLSLIIILQLIPAFAAKEAEKYKLNLTFNDIETNQTAIDGLTVKGGKAAVAVTSPTNKGLYLKNHILETSVIAQGADVEYTEDAVYSVDVMVDNLPVNLTFGTAATLTASSGADINLFQIKDNAIIAHDGKRIGAIGRNNYTTITVIVKKLLVCDYYINGAKVLSNWDLANTSLGSFIAIRQPGGNSCYIDNIRCYKGSEINKKMLEAPFTDEIVDIINQQDFNGDITFFDNRFCYNSSTPRYYRFTSVPKSNEIIATRLADYQHAARTDYIYMQRNDNIDDCYFEVDITMPSIAHADDFKHRNLKMEGDFKADALQDINFLVRDSKTMGRSIDTNFNINPDGSISGGGAKILNVVKQGEWFHLLWAMNLDAKKYDVYVDGKKVISNANLNANMDQFNMLRVNLNYSSAIGDLYVDNFNVTGLIKPIVDGAEIKTGVIPTDDNIIEFMEGKIGMHVYGNMLHKDGVKTPLETKGIYDKETEQYYVTSDAISKIFDLNLIDGNGEITGDITIKKDGTVTLGNGSAFKLLYTPKIENGKMYLPIRQFATDAAGKYVWWFKTGILLFSDYELNIDTTGWKYQNERKASGCTVWNDIDYLNGYLQYKRPDAKKLKADYIAATGDLNFTQHPRLYYTTADFANIKEKYELNEDPVFTEEIASYITKADNYKADNFIYRQLSDLTETPIAEELSNRFKAWGYAYNLTGERKYAEAAFEQFEKLAAFPDLNTSNVMDAGYALQCIAIGYDWLYNGFTLEQQELALGVLRHYLEVLGDAFYGRLTSVSEDISEWQSVKTMGSHNAIINSGITLAAIAAIEYEPDTAFRYIADSVRSIEYCLQIFPTDDAQAKDMPYLNLIMQSLAPWVLNTEKNFGESYNVMDCRNMNGILDFNISNSRHW